MPELPSGTVTFLFTDVEGSTRLLKQLRDRYGEALGDHQAILRDAFARHGGREIDTQGDSFFVAFRSAKDAVAAAVTGQLALADHAWPDGGEFRVRMGIHTGEPTVGEERYVGLGVHRAARICAAGHGGQVLLSQTTRELLRDDPIPDVSARDLGAHLLKDLDEPGHLYQLAAPGLAETFPPLKTADSPPFAGQEDRLARALEGMGRRRRVVAIAAALGAAVIALGIWLLTTGGGGPNTLASVKADAVGVIDSHSGEIVSQIPVGAAPFGVVADSHAIWVTNRDEQAVSEIQLKTNVRQTIAVGAGPAGIAIGAGDVWILNALDGTISRINPQKGGVVDTITAGNGPTAIVDGLGALWVANADATITKIDPKSGEVLETLDAVPGANAIAVGFGSVWVASGGMGNVSRLDPETGVVVHTVNVGNGPRALAVGAGSVWVANNLDGTVSRIDPETNTVTATIRTGPGPSGLAVGAGTVWVANEGGDSLTRIDAATDRPALTVPLGNPPQGVAIAGDSVLVTVRATGSAHRGGTLMVDAGRRGLTSIDPSLSYEWYSYAIPSLTNDGLVAFTHTGGTEGSVPFPDLAMALPLPTDGGRTYTFELRSGIHYSTGQAVRPEDIRRAIERDLRLGSPGSVYYSGIVGAGRCAKAPTTCDLSNGIVVDDDAGLVTFHLTAPDPDFLYKLALPFADALPPGVPNEDVGTRPVPATGPYEITEYVPDQRLVFERNPQFHEWSRDRPDGYPDRIVWRLDVEADAATRAVENGEADVADFVPPELLTEVRTQYASQLYVDTFPSTFFYFLNAKVPPFDDVRVRRALNYAVDRKAVLDLASGAEVAKPTCQVLPPNFPGYRPYCPYTANPSAGGAWVAPDLDRARALVAASGTKGQRVQVWTSDKAEGGYMATVLRELGYRAGVKTITPFDKYTTALFQNFATFQIAQFRWFPDYPAASGFINSAIFDCSYFCDRAIDREIARARTLQATDPVAANELWAKIDRDLTDQAPWLFLYNTKQPHFVSSRVGNFQYNIQYGILLDQLWVR